jgi:hypothetical protein
MQHCEIVAWKYTTGIYDFIKFVIPQNIKEQRNDFTNSTYSLINIRLNDVNYCTAVNFEFHVGIK